MSLPLSADVIAKELQDTCDLLKKWVNVLNGEGVMDSNHPVGFPGVHYTGSNVEDAEKEALDRMLREIALAGAKCEALTQVLYR